MLPSSLSVHRGNSGAGRTLLLCGSVLEYRLCNHGLVRWIGSLKTATRCRYRMSLRADNADLRLTAMGAAATVPSDDAARRPARTLVACEERAGTALPPSPCRRTPPRGDAAVAQGDFRLPPCPALPLVSHGLRVRCARTLIVMKRHSVCAPCESSSLVLTCCGDVHTSMLCCDPSY